MLAMGFTVPPGPRENEAFWLLGRLTYKDVVCPAQAGIMFIAWRCLYAAIVHSRVDKTPLRLTSAYNRTLQMTITRLRAYGEFWRRWTKINHFTGKKSVFPENKRKRVVIKMAADSTYTIHYLLLQEYHTTVSVARQAFIGPLEKPPPPNRNHQNDQANPHQLHKHNCVRPANQAHQTKQERNLSRSPRENASSTAPPPPETCNNVSATVGLTPIQNPEHPRPRARRP